MTLLNHRVENHAKKVPIMVGEWRSRGGIYKTKYFLNTSGFSLFNRPLVIIIEQLNKRMIISKITIN